MKYTLLSQIANFFLLLSIRYFIMFLPNLMHFAIWNKNHDNAVFIILSDKIFVHKTIRRKNFAIILPSWNNIKHKLNKQHKNYKIT